MKLATNPTSSGELKVSRNVWRACGWGAWDSVGWECGRTFLYLQFSLLTAHLVPIIARTRLWPLQRFTVGRLAVVAFVGTRRPLRSFEVFEDGQTTLLTPVLVFPRFSPSLACGISARNISSVSGFVPARGEPEECLVEREFVPFSRPENRAARSERRRLMPNVS